MAGIFRALLDNGDRVTSFVILLILVVILGYIVYALASGKMPSPGDYKRLSKDHAALESTCKAAEDTLAVMTKELSESRIAHASAAVRIEFLELDGKRKDFEISDLKSRTVRLEVELDELRRARWEIPESRRR